jgi:hypothetical protein
MPAMAIISNGQPAPPPRTRMGYSKERAGNVYSVHNNLPYAEKLHLLAGEKSD